MRKTDTPAPGTGTRWKPTLHEHYFVILGDGSIQSFPWNDTEFDHRAWQFGNCFKRRTTAEQARQAIHDVLRAVQQEQGEASGCPS